jgi:tetratricopeptide (TPR) repeat protein
VADASHSARKQLLTAEFVSIGVIRGSQLHPANSTFASANGSLLGLRKTVQYQTLGSPAEPQAAITTSDTAISSPRKRWFRLLAFVVIPLGLLLSAEGVLRLVGYGYSPRFFKERRTSSARVMIENRDFGRRFFPPGLVRYAQPLTMATPKPPNTMRVFVLGESAAMGDPDFKFGLPRMLEVLLRERFPNRQVEVINVAMVAINSNVILPIARDCAGQEGDLWVVYTGNNEVIGPFGSASVFGARAPALALVRAGLWLKTTKVGQLLDAALQRVRQGNRALPEWNGMEMMSSQKVAHNSPATQRVYQHFERNLRDLLTVGTRAGVPIVLCTVATNLRDCGPFASLHRTGLTAPELAEWLAAYEAGATLQGRGNFNEAKLAYERAARIDAEFAELDFRRAECCRRLGQNPEAETLFGEARNEDALQFRADRRINEIIRRCAAEFAGRGVRLVDADKLFAANSPQGLTGAEYFYEHVHLTPEGNYLLARAISQPASEALSLRANSDWASSEDCFRLLGLTDWNRYDAFNVIWDRIQGAPFTNQVDHARQLDQISRQLERYKIATKPAELRREAGEVARLVSRFPRDPDLRWNLAALLENAGDMARAEEQWRVLMTLQPQAALPVFNLAKLLDGLGRHDEAIPLYGECLQLDPDYYQARYALGLLCLRTGRVPEALHHLELAVRQRPQALETRFACAEALAKSRDAAGAEKQLREVLRLDPQNDTARQRLTELRAKTAQ